MTVPLQIAVAVVVFGGGTLANVIAVMLPSRALALAITTAALVLPFLLDAPPLCRALTAQGLIVESWRVVEIVREPARYPRRERVARILLLPFEYTFLARTPRRWPVRAIVQSSVLLAIGIPGFILASRLGPAVPPYAIAGWPRWLGLTVAAYLIMEGATQQWVGVLPAFGWQHRPYQRHPIVSRTLAEFWGVRWSSVVHEWLRSNVYRPLARRKHPRAGVVAAFGVSAILHGFLVWPAAGAIPALWMLSFFLAHGVGMVIEAKLRVRRWPPFLGRLFVIGWFAATVPLFMEPIVRAVGL